MDQDSSILDVFNFIVNFDLGEQIQNFIAQIVGWVQDLFGTLFGGLVDFSE